MITNEIIHGSALRKKAAWIGSDAHTIFVGQEFCSGHTFPDIKTNPGMDSKHDSNDMDSRRDLNLGASIRIYGYFPSGCRCPRHPSQLLLALGMHSSCDSLDCNWSGLGRHRSWGQSILGFVGGWGSWGQVPKQHHANNIMP